MGSLRVPVFAGSKGNGVQSLDRTAAVRGSDTQSAIDLAGREGARRDDPKSEDLPADQVSVSSASRMICPERFARGMRCAALSPVEALSLTGYMGPCRYVPFFCGHRLVPGVCPWIPGADERSAVPRGPRRFPLAALPHTGVIFLACICREGLV